MQDFDDHGQPVNKFYNAKRIEDRAIDELLGIAKGIKADRIINQQEASFVLDWLEANDHVIDKWPANILYKRIREMMGDGVLDEDEKFELINLLDDTVGGVVFAEKTENETTALPLSTPAPEILFSGKIFCFTGKFFYGSRSKCEAAVMCRGGLAVKSVSKKLNYVVIGSCGSSDWIHSPYGRKIEAAIEMRDREGSPAIVSERHWVDFVS